MMREIKFRIWDLVEKRYDSNCHIYMDLNGNTTNYQTGAGGAEYLLEQYTGLKDENGVKIYEGDICNIHIFTQELGENMGVMEGEREFVAEICFDCICGLSVKNNTGDSGPLYMYCGFEDSEEQIEVIGNIHQHPNLLEVE